MNTILSIGKAVYPVHAALGKALGLPTFTADDVKAFDVVGEEEGIPNVYSGTVYGLSATHLLVGLAAGLALAVPLGFAAKKGRATYRRRRAARPASTRRTYYRRKR